MHIQDRDKIVTLVQARRWPQVSLFESPDPEQARHYAYFVMAAHYCVQKSACGQCGPCKDFQNQRLADLFCLETDERQIKLIDVHQLIEHIGLKALSAQDVRGGLIIDADKLNISAANALLKSLEEAPESALLILSTAKPKYMLETILSRCVRWRIKHQSEGTTSIDVSMVRKLLAARDEIELVDVAEELVKRLGYSAADLGTQVEMALNQAYREGDIAIIGSFSKIRERRDLIRRLKNLAVAHKVSLNAQLSAESLGL